MTRTARRQMNIERMQETIALLRSVPPEKFEYASWGRTAKQTKKLGVRVSCGTVACAGGWMTQHKPFKKQGLKHLQTNLEPQFEDQSGELYYGANALALFLGITTLQAETAFVYLANTFRNKPRSDALRDVTANDVADYLEKLLNAKLRRTPKSRAERLRDGTKEAFTV